MFSTLQALFEHPFYLPWFKTRDSTMTVQKVLLSTMSRTKKQSFSLEFQRHLDHGVAKKWCSMPVASWVCTWHSWGSGEINDNHGTLVSPFEDLSCEWTEHVTPNMGNQIHLAINYITIPWKIVWIQTQSFQFSWMTKEETKWKLEEREMPF